MQKTMTRKEAKMMISDAVLAIESKYENKPDVLPIYYVHTTHPGFSLSAMSGPFGEFGDLVQRMFDLDIRGWHVDKIIEEPRTEWSPEFIKREIGGDFSIVIEVRILCSMEVLN